MLTLTGPVRAWPKALSWLLSLLQVREELLEVEKRVAEMDGNSDSATSEYARLKQVSLSPLPCTEITKPR